ncbi:hypothetical protein J5N97_020488 [Dioscorea zingiberensis]|uniref:SBP-type domain-containing protein n=1 Tax=Dioscorea zingiberensis TaxID=325984 RepID=A0A9D5HDG9_9LILI|nr:hypothetical protein J5N97_020488 [Dioscorea zingiberensis]
MDWDLKMPSWDFVEVEQSAGTNIGSVDCLVDLKLGGLGEGWKIQPTMSEMPSGSGSSKRARTPNNGRQVASCLVDGCKSDLSKCREYHRRHKVFPGGAFQDADGYGRREGAEILSAVQQVMEQGLCIPELYMMNMGLSQLSIVIALCFDDVLLHLLLRHAILFHACFRFSYDRFHSLVEFDEVKRSCRKRLDGHNRRRRKPQPDPTASFFATHQGSRFISYPPMFPAAAQSLTWPGIIKIENETFCNNQPMSYPGWQQEAPSSFSISFKDGKKFPFLQRGSTKDSACQSLLKNIASGNSSTKAFPDGVARIRSSERALSLLSSPTGAAMNLGQMVTADQIPFSQPLISALPYSALGQYSGLPASTFSASLAGLSCSGIADDHGATILVSDASNTDLHCHGFFHAGIEGPSAGTSQVLPFEQ